VQNITQIFMEQSDRFVNFAAFFRGMAYEMVMGEKGPWWL